MKASVAALAEQALVNEMPFLLLRGVDEQARAEGDIDILVPHGKAVLACQILASAARQSGMYLLFFRDIGYLAQIVLTCPTADGNVQSVKVDFFSGLEWYNAGSGELTDRFFRDILASAQTDEARNSIAAAVNFYQKCMTVGKLSSRDMMRVQKGGASTKLLLEIASKLKLPISEAQAKTGQLSRFALWRMRAASSGQPMAYLFVKWFFDVVVAHLKFKLGFGFKSGLWISLSGLDGSGKSTQLDMLLNAYEKAGMKVPQTIHLLHRWIPMPHQLFRRQATANNYTRPYSEAAVTSKSSALLRLSYYLVAFSLAKVALSVSVFRGNVIISDRCFADFASDLCRARIPHQNLNPFVLKMISPSGCLLFVDVPPAVVVKRKGELTLIKAEQLQKNYLEVITFIDGLIIEGNDSKEAVFTSILRKIDAVYNDRIHKSL